MTAHPLRLLLPAAALLLTAPAQGMDDDTKKLLAGAAAVAGVAAIVHSQHHHDDSKHHRDEKQEAAFERGYRDGLYHARYNDHHDSRAYRKGYDAGAEERLAGVRHNQPNRWEQDQHGAPNYMLHTCAVAVARAFDVREGHVTPLNSHRADKHGYSVRLKYGHHKQAICHITEHGRVSEIRKKEL